MAQPGTKPALASSTVWGTILGGISAGLLIAGIKVEGLDDPSLPLELSALFGALLSLYGRLRATTLISGWFK